MRTIIMAAGSSQRLRPLTETIPKTLLALGEKTMLAHILDQARAAGLHHFDIVTGHGHPAVEAFANEYQATHDDININIIYNDEYDSAGNIVSLQKAAEVFDEDFIIINSDTIFHGDILKRLVATDHPNAMIVDDTKELGEEEMKIALNNESGTIMRIHKSLDPSESHGEYIGVMKLSKDVKSQLLESLDTVIAQDNSLYYEDALERLVSHHNASILPVSTNGQPAMEIDTHEDLDAAKQLIKKMN